MLDWFEELDKFSHVKFTDSEHFYEINGKRPTSVTTLIDKYVKPFDSEYWSQRKADELGVTKEFMLHKWEDEGEFANRKGSRIHAYIENYLGNKIFPYHETDYKDKNAVNKAIDAIIPQVHKFYNDSLGRLIPIRSEFVIGDEELMIAGMIDQIFFNKKSGMLELWDWKTSKPKKMKASKYKLIGSLSHVSDSSLDKYALQLGLYKYIIEKNTNLRFGNSYLGWFNEENTTYKVFKCTEYPNEVNTIVREHVEAL